MALTATFNPTTGATVSEKPPKKKPIRVLILTKKNQEYGSEVNFKSGLNNTAMFLAEELSENLKIEAQFETCIDGNQIDSKIFDYKPSHVVLEAIWVTPLKLTEIQKLWPKVIFTVRVHSKITFLAYEGVAIEWIKEFEQIPNVYISFNSKETAKDFKIILQPQVVVWLPNIYKKIDYEKISLFNSIMSYFKKPKHHTNFEFHVACFGAIRPMKDILLQAFAAMKYCDQRNLKLNFHVNTGRVEQRGDSVLKNLKALFQNTKHKLVEHDWLNHKEFLELIKVIDLGMQVSLNESFNVVTADYVYNFKPIVVSHEIHWVANACKTENEVDAMVRTISTVINDVNILKENLHLLNQYNGVSLNEWRRFLVETIID